MGVRLLELLTWRERGGRRDVRLLDALKFVHTTLWRALCGRVARDLEQSNTVGGVGGRRVGWAGGAGQGWCPGRAAPPGGPLSF